jgi:hypothetical protein
MNKHLFSILALVCVAFSCSDDGKDEDPKPESVEVSFAEPDASIDVYAGDYFQVKIKQFDKTKHGLSLNGVTLSASGVGGKDSNGYTVVEIFTPAKVGSGRLVLTNGEEKLNGPTVTYNKQYYAARIWHLYHGMGMAVLPNDRVLIYDPGWTRWETMRFDGFRKDEHDMYWATVRMGDTGFDNAMIAYGLYSSDAENGGTGMTVDPVGDLYFYQLTGDYQTHDAPARRNILTTPATAMTESSFMADFYHPESVQDQITQVSDLESDSKGNLYTVLTKQKYIQKITEGVVSNFVGSTTQGTADGTGANAQFSLIQAIGIDGQDNIYVADSNRVRQITPAGVVTTLAGSTTAGYVDGTLTEARFNYIAALTAAPDGTLFLYDRDNKSVRIISADRSRVSTLRVARTNIAGNTFEPGFSDHHLPMTLDSRGNLFLAQSAENKSRGQAFHILVPEDNIPDDVFNGIISGSFNYVVSSEFVGEE